MMKTQQQVRIEHYKFSNSNHFLTTIYLPISKEKEKVNCRDGVIVDNCEKCGSGQNGHLSCSSNDCEWRNGKCVLRGKLLEPSCFKKSQKKSQPRNWLG